ncbi:MAG: hypothetical protein C0594_06780 [Marinilabiliales bacterium]|nr:MAG: hypothetical protein C0594_06780 [Marinilabiliales bacterium]
MNKNLIINISHPLRAITSYKKLLFKHRNFLIAPFYHAVYDETPDFIKHLYTPRNFDCFKKDIEHFQKYYTLLETKELKDLTSNQTKFKKPPLFLSFDDGLSACLPIAEYMKQKGIPATFFISPQFIDNKSLFHRYKASLLISKIDSESGKNLDEVLKVYKLKNKSYLIQLLRTITYKTRNILDDIAKLLNYDFNDFLANHKPYLSKNEVLKIKNMGFTIGAHSIDHPEYILLNEKKQIEQTIESVNMIMTLFNEKTSLFAFPFSDVGLKQSFFQSLLKYGVDFTFGTSGMKQDSAQNNYQRIPMEKSLSSAKNILHSEHILYAFKKRLNKHKIERL